MASNKFNYYDGNGKLNDSITDISNYQNAHSLNGALYFDMDRKTIFANPDGTGIKEFGGTNQPIMEKEYDYTCTAADTNNGYIFFGNIVPTSNDPGNVWYIKYRLTVDLTSTHATYSQNNKYCHGIYECQIGTSGSSLIYHNFNQFYSGSYYPIYYHLLAYYTTTNAGTANEITWETKYANKATNPIKVGARIYSAYVDTQPRHYKIEIYETYNCTFTFPDNIETYGNVYTAAKYGTCNTMNATSQGLQESGDATDVSTMQFTHGRLTAGANGMKTYSLVMQDHTGKWQSFVTGTGGTGANKPINTAAKFRLGSKIYYLSKASDTAADTVTSNSIVRAYSALIDFRYSFPGITANSLGNGLTYNKPVYLVGSLDNDGYFRLDSTKCWTQDEPTTDDGKIYIKLTDGVYADYNTTSMPSGNYRGDLLSDGTPWYYKKGKFQVYYGSGGGGSALQNMTYNSGIKIGEYLDDEETSHNIYIPEPIVSTQYSTGINVASYKTSSGTSQIKIPEISTMPAYASGISIAYYPNAASGNTYIHIPIQRVTSMPSSPNTNMIYIVSEMSNGTTNPDEPGTGLDDYVTLSQVYEYVSNNYVSFTTLNTRLNDSSYITSTILNNLLDDFIVQEQLDESAYITQDYLNAAGYLTSHQSLANYATKSELQTSINNLVNGAPAVLDTLGEIATALSNNQSVSTAITTQIANLKTDLNSYAKTVTLNGTTKSITAGTNDINIGTVITSHASHALTVTNGTATSTSGTITFVESVSGCNATTGNLTASTVRKTVTIPSIGTLKTDNASAQTVSSGESLSGTINLHKVSKTGNYNDLNNRFWIQNSGEYGITAGSIVSAQGSESLARGSRAWAFGFASTAVGTFVTAYGDYSHAEGDLTTAYYQASHAEGEYTRAIGRDSHSEGNYTVSYGFASHAEGGSTLAYVFEPEETTKNGVQTYWMSLTANNRFSITYGMYSHTEGFNNITLGDYSHAEGGSTAALGSYTHSEGWLTIAEGNISHTEGSFNIAYGNSSHAEGWSTNAYGHYSHSEGSYSNAYGENSHSEGAGTIAYGNSSHTEGFNTIANNNSEHSQGQYNVSHKVNTTFGNAGNTIFSVGVGTSDSNRKNAIEIMQNGNTYLYGVGNYNGNTLTNATPVQNLLLPPVSNSDNGKILQVVNGVWTLVTPVSIYSGSGEPANNLGNNGDIYIQN